MYQLCGGFVYLLVHASVVTGNVVKNIIDNKSHDRRYGTFKHHMICAGKVQTQITYRNYKNKIQIKTHRFGKYKRYYVRMKYDLGGCDVKVKGIVFGADYDKTNGIEKDTSNVENTKESRIRIKRKYHNYNVNNQNCDI